MNTEIIPAWKGIPHSFSATVNRLPNPRRPNVEINFPLYNKTRNKINFVQINETLIIKGGIPPEWVKMLLLHTILFFGFWGGGLSFFKIWLHQVSVAVCGLPFSCGRWAP